MADENEAGVTPEQTGTTSEATTSEATAPDAPAPAPDAPDAPDDGAAAVSASAPSPLIPGTFPWAADQIVNGRTVRRAAWVGNKTIGTDHPSRKFLENEDMTAMDWELM